MIKIDSQVCCQKLSSEERLLKRITKRTFATVYNRSEKVKKENPFILAT
jgi:hypothetical protein